MELSSFLFGNINEEGKLENEDLDDELRKYLTQFSNQRESSDLFKQIVETDLAASQPQIPAPIVPQTSRTSIIPLPDAIDYSDMQEEAEDSAPPSAKDDFSKEDFEEFDDLFQQSTHSKELDSVIVEKTPVTQDALLPELKAFLGEFKRSGAIKFTSLFFPNYSSVDEFSSSSHLQCNLPGKKNKIKRREENPNADLDTRELFLLPPGEIESRVKNAPKISFKGPPTLSASLPSMTANSFSLGAKMHIPRKKLSATQISWGRSMEKVKSKLENIPHAYISNLKLPSTSSLPSRNENFYNFQLIPWENKAENIIAGREEKQLSVYFIQKPYLLPHNWDLEKTSWEDSVIWNEGEIPKTIPTLNLLLNMNDPYLLFDRMNKEEISRRVTKASRIISNKLRKIRKLKKSGILPNNDTGSSLDSSMSNLVLASASTSSAFFSKPFPAERCNISNDRFYESVKDQQKAIANAFEKVTLHHSIPALKLQPPHFKCTLSRKELRCFHKPAFFDPTKFPPNELTVSFCPLKENKRAKKQREFGEVIKNSKGLTLRDDTFFGLFEFMEETPLLMSNSGMGSLLNVYYRKKATKDPYIPTCEVGIPTLLEPTESGPFMGFVDVAPGSELPVLYNNLYRAPIAFHQGNDCDFILIRYAREGEKALHEASSTSCQCYLRKCTCFVAVGQTLPCLDVYGPHSRKLNAYSRNRIQIAAYRYFGKKENYRKRLKIASLTTLFPQFSEGTIRKWLKDYAESTRQGKDSGFWTMKPNAPQLAEEELQQLVTPEAVCQYESMLVGQQRLLDAGHASSSGAFDENNAGAGGAETSTSIATAALDSDEQPIDDDLKLTPWNLTNNFLLATQGKAMLELHGVGDPSGGHGEGFSFVRVPLKTQIAFRQAFESGSSSIAPSPRKIPQSKIGNSPSSGPFYNLPTQAEQQAAYKREIARIWNRQLERLRSTSPPSLTTSSSHNHQSSCSNYNASLTTMNNGKVASFSVDHDGENLPAERISPFPLDPKLVPRQFRGKRLVINRKFAMPDGSIREQSETICDARIISAYLKANEERKKSSNHSNVATATKVKIILHPQQQQSSSLSSNQKSHSNDSFLITGNVGSHSHVTTTTTGEEKPQLKCGACGLLGHMRTNRACPMFKAATVPSSSLEQQASNSPSSMNVVTSSQQQVPGEKLILKLPSFTGSAASQTKKRKVPETPVSQEGPMRRKRPLASLNGAFERIIGQLQAIPDSWPFHRPVPVKQFPDYPNLISCPMDLSTAKAKCIGLVYEDSETFLQDMRQIAVNCERYNGQEHYLSRVARSLVKLAVKLIGDGGELSVEIARAEAEHKQRNSNASSTATTATSSNNLTAEEQQQQEIQPSLTTIQQQEVDILQ